MISRLFIEVGSDIWLQTAYQEDLASVGICVYCERYKKKYGDKEPGVAARINGVNISTIKGECEQEDSLFRCNEALEQASMEYGNGGSFDCLSAQLRESDSEKEPEYNTEGGISESTIPCSQNPSGSFCVVSQRKGEKR